MHTVLVISYHFPPIGGARTRRTLKFLKYLPKFQWQPVVLTAKTANLFAFNASSVEKIPEDVAIYRANDLSSRIQRLRGLALNESSERLTSPVRLERSPMLKRGLRGVLSLLKKWLAIPDPLIVFWVPFAICKGLLVFRYERIDLIYATAPPFSNHIVAVALKWLTQTPVVTDFRDAWVTNPMRTLRLPLARRRVELQVERGVIRHSDLVVSTTDGMRQDFHTRYPQERDQKFALVSNGYDREDELRATAAPCDAPDHKMRIIHTGNMTPERSPLCFLESLLELLDYRPELKDQIEVVFVGESEFFLDGYQLDDYLNAYALHEVVKLPGYVSRSEAMQYQTHADILLLLIGVVPKEHILTYGIASKLYDYMLSKKPIMTLADQGPVSEIVERTNMGVVIEPSDVDSMKAYLSHMFDQFMQGQLNVVPNQDEIDKYDVQLLSENLAGLFETCLPAQ